MLISNSSFIKIRDINIKISSSSTNCLLQQFVFFNNLSSSTICLLQQFVFFNDLLSSTIFRLLSTIFCLFFVSCFLSILNKSTLSFYRFYNRASFCYELRRKIASVLIVSEINLEIFFEFYSQSRHFQFWQKQSSIDCFSRLLEWSSSHFHFTFSFSFVVIFNCSIIVESKF